MKTVATLLILSSLLIAAAAEAGTPAAPRSEAREHRQEARIDHGVANGELTAAETRRLDRGQSRVDAAQAAARADGEVTKREKLRLERLQDRQSARIARQKRDAQDRRD